MHAKTLDLGYVSSCRQKVSTGFVAGLGWLLGTLVCKSVGCPANTVEVTVVITTGKFPEEIGWTIEGSSVNVMSATYVEDSSTSSSSDEDPPPSDESSSSSSSNSEEDEEREYSKPVCLVPGDHVFVARDSYGDGWNGGFFTVSFRGQTLIGPVYPKGDTSRHVFKVPGDYCAVLYDYGALLRRLANLGTPVAGTSPILVPVLPCSSSRKKQGVREGAFCFFFAVGHSSFTELRHSIKVLQGYRWLVSNVVFWTASHCFGA